MWFRSCLGIFCWAWATVAVSAEYFSIECQYCTELGYRQAALNAVPWPPGGDALVIDYPQATLKSYTVFREDGPDGLFVSAFETAVPVEIQADFDVVIDFIEWAESSTLGFELPPELGISSAFEVVNNGRNALIISGWINEQQSIATPVQGVVDALRGILGSHNPNVPIVVEVVMPDGSVVDMKATSKILTTPDGPHFVVEFEVVSAIDADGNPIRFSNMEYVGQAGVVSGGNASSFSGFLTQLGFSVQSQGNDGSDDLLCDWSCPTATTCSLKCSSGSSE